MLYQLLVRDEGACVFTCKGCREVARLLGEVEDLIQTMFALLLLLRFFQSCHFIPGFSSIFFQSLSRDHPLDAFRVLTSSNSLTEESRERKETAERNSSEDSGPL